MYPYLHHPMHLYLQLHLYLSLSLYLCVRSSICMRAEPIVMISFGLQTRRNNGRTYTVILFGIVQITFHIFGIYIEWQNIYTAPRQRGRLNRGKKL